MKKILLTIGVLCAFALSSPAQSLAGFFRFADDHEFVFDVSGGANVSSLTYLPKGGPQTMMDGRVMGFNLGAGVSFHLLEGVWIESGLGLSSRGGRDVSLFNNKFSCCYLELPLALSLRIPVAPELKAYIDLGGYGAYGLFGSTVNEVTSFPFFGNDPANVARRPDYGLLAGFGGILDDRFKVGFRYEYGLGNISSASTLQTSYGSIFNSAMTFSVGYIF